MYHANCMKPEQGNQRSWDTCHGRRACRRPSSLHPEVCVLHHVRLIKGTFGVQFPPQGNVVFCTKGRHTCWDWVIRGHGKLQCVLFITLKRVLRSCSVPIRRFFLMWCLAPYALGQSLPYSMDAVTLDAVALRHSRCSSRLSFTFFFCVGSVSPVPFPFSAFCAGVVRGFRLFANASVVSTSNFPLFAGGPACTMHVGRIYAHARAHKHKHGTSETPVPSPI